MNLYQINESLQNLAFIDMETGVIDVELLNQLHLDFDTKVENIACIIKNERAESVALKNEENILAERRKTKDNNIERLTEYLQSILVPLNKPKYEYLRAVISFRKSSSVEVDESFVEWAKKNADDLLTYKEPTASRTAIKAAIESGQAFEYARIIESKNMQIK